MLYLSKAKGRGNEEVRKKNGHMQPVRESKLTKDSIPNKQKPHTYTQIHTHAHTKHACPKSCQEYVHTASLK